MKLIPYEKKASYVLLIFILSLLGCQDAIKVDPGPNPLPGPVHDWTIQWGDVLTNFTDVFFIDQHVGWIVGNDNTILSTTMGGQTWPQAPVNNYVGNFRSVHFIDQTQGWIAGDMNGVSVDGNVYISVNGGAYPETQKTIKYPLNIVFALDKDHVWTAGDNGQILHTSDGGVNWNESSTILETTINDIYFLNRDTGFASGDNGQIMRSMDGGITWESEFSLPGIDIKAIHFFDTVTGWASGSWNTILLYDNDSDLKWTKTSIDTESVKTTWNDIFFIDDEIGWIVGEDGSVYKSENGGRTWVKESTGITSNLNAIYMVDYQKGWIVGEEGVILSYTPD
jgi:photosystem II stability/assembly factor-like uncharacterized protein